MKICISSLRTPVEVQSPVRADDGYGGRSNSSWSRKMTVFCKVQHGTGSEPFRQDRLISQGVTKVTTRYTSEICETDRLVINGMPYNIRFIRNIEERNRFLEIVCEKGVVD